MQKTTAMRLEENFSGETTRRAPLADRRSHTHKRMERWIRLQQFVYGLPEDYSYAICVKEGSDGTFASHSLVKVGWMNWYGFGKSRDCQHGLATALLAATEALSANSTASLLHRVFRMGRIFGLHRLRRSRFYLRSPARPAAEPGDLLAS